MTYLLKRDEEPENAVITLVKASKDGGRDVVVHHGGFLSKVVQCKNLGNKFPQTALLEELLKFVLHDYRERYIPESGISYELWAPGGLTGPADTWLAEWPRSLTADELRTAFDNVLQANKMLRSLEWEEVSEYVIDTLTNRIRLSRHEAASLSRKVRSASDLYVQFFEVTLRASLDQVEEVLTPHFEASNRQLADLTDAVHGNDIDNEINEARDLVNERQFRDAAAILKRLESKKRHRLDNHQRYRIASNYGAIAFGEDRVEEAARHFLDAVRLAPEDERARVNEVFAYYLLKDSPRAFQLATEQRLKYPFNARLVGIWINSAPAETSVETLEAGLDSAILGDAEVCAALARRCMMADQSDKAEGYCDRAITVAPKWSQPWMLRAQIGIGKLMEENAGLRSLSEPRNTILKNAVADATEAIKASETDSSWATAEALAVRAQLHFMLGEASRGNDDAKAAYKLRPDILSVLLLMAQYHLMAGATDSAIELLAEGYAKEARPDIVLLYAKTLANRGKDADLARAVEVSNSVDVVSIPPRMRDSFVINVAQLMARLSDWKAVEAYIQRYEATIHPATALSLRVLIRFNRNEREEANRLADDALRAMSENVQAGTKELFAGALMQLDRAEEALPLFQELFDKDIPTFDPRQLLACADHLHLHDKVLEVCDKLHARRAPDWQMLEFEVQYLERYNRDKAIERLQEFLRAPNCDSRSLLRCKASRNWYGPRLLTFPLLKSFRSTICSRLLAFCGRAKIASLPSTMPTAIYAGTSTVRKLMKPSSRLW